MTVDIQTGNRQMREQDPAPELAPPTPPRAQGATTLKRSLQKKLAARKAAAVIAESVALGPSAGFERPYFKVCILLECPLKAHTLCIACKQDRSAPRAPRHAWEGSLCERLAFHKAGGVIPEGVALGAPAGSDISWVYISQLCRRFLTVGVHAVLQLAGGIVLCLECLADHATTCRNFAARCTSVQMSQHIIGRLIVRPCSFPPAQGMS